MASATDDLFTRAGEALAACLRPRAAEADALARTLAPDGAGPGIRLAAYDGPLAAPTKVVAYQARFPDAEGFPTRLAAGDPGALEFGFELVSRLDPEAVVEPAAWLLPASPWNGLGSALGRALGRCTSARSFRLLVDHPGVPYLRVGLATHGWPGGVDEARAATRAVDWTAPVEPRLRDQTLPWFGYRLRHDPTAFPEVVALLDGSSGQVWATHALARLEAGRVVLRGRLCAVPPGTPVGFPERRAVRLLLEDDASSVVHALGGEPFLASPDGRPRLDALLDQVRTDTWAKAGDGGPRGWLTADPAVVRLCAGLKGDANRALASLARDLLATLPKAERPRPPKARAVAPTPTAPDDALVAKLTALRDGLDRLVAHLKADGYRFAAPRTARVAPRAKDLAALARLEKRAPVPAALATFWRVVGGVDLRGRHPDWPVDTWLGFPGAREPVWSVDPLVVAPAADVVAEALDDATEPPFLLRFAPDATGAAGFSGGALGVWVPDAAADPALDGAEGTFLGHLDRAWAWAGFPGFAAIPERPEAWLDRLRAATR